LKQLFCFVQCKDEKEGYDLKDIEFRLVSELMKNSRRSDRELAKAIGISQPTVSRTIKKLKERDIIKEYTMIPDFNKLGYKILAITFIKLKKVLDQEQIERTRKIVKESLNAEALEVVMLERGLGLDSDVVLVTYHEDYSSHLKFVAWLRQSDFLAIEEVRSFLVSLEDKVRYRPLTFSALAEHVLQMKENRK
jgi:DNA-binding Lrp family transcriptional regulator